MSLYDVWTRDPAFYHLLRVGLHWYASEIRQIAGGTLYVADQNDPVWGFVSDDLLIAGYVSGPIAHLLPEAERTIGKFRRPVRSISLDDGRGLVFVAKKGGWKKAAGPWRLVGYASGDWEWVMSGLFDGGLNWSDPGFHAWTRDPVFFHLLEVGLHWLASEAHEISGGTLYVVDRHVPVWGFVSDDLLIAGCAPGPIAHLLSEAERTIGKLRGPVRSSCPDDGLDLRFVAKKVAGPWQLMFYASGDWEWVMSWIDARFYGHGPGRHVAQWMRDELSDPS